jgi:hypothetical protein
VCIGEGGGGGLERNKEGKEKRKKRRDEWNGRMEKRFKKEGRKGQKPVKKKSSEVHCAGG